MGLDLVTNRARTRNVFLLSPAYCGGVRGRLLLGGAGAFPLAVCLREGAATIGDVFAFVSGLYFRGKLAYARAFAPAASIFVITPGWGLVSAEHPVTLEELRAIAEIGVSPGEPRYCQPLERAAAGLIQTLGRSGAAVLLGSIASDKYVEPLRALGERLRFPAEFVGRGDMSRGGLMLRCARERCELSYIPIAGAQRRGPRPPRLEPIRQAGE